MILAIIQEGKVWRYNGSGRPDFAEVPSEGQESVWDYPRPPRIERVEADIEVKNGTETLASSKEAICISETASPPVFYLSFDEVGFYFLEEMAGSSFCEWKGQATYWGLIDTSKKIVAVAWSYKEPMVPYRDLKNHMAFYPGRVKCFFDGEEVTPQPGGFYGGWMLDRICGPIKGLSGTESW